MSWKLLPFFISVPIFFYVTGAFYDHPPESVDAAVLKLLPVLSLVWFVNTEAFYMCKDPHYRDNIALGLLISILGDISLVWRNSLFIPGLLFFAIAQGMYIRAFRLSPFGPNWAAGLSMSVGTLMFSYILVGITENVLKILAGFYGILIFTMGWRVVVRFADKPNKGTLSALLGALSFVVSDFLIGVDKWRFPIPNAAFYIMATYYTAQMFLALSAVYQQEVSEDQDKKKD